MRARGHAAIVCSVTANGLGSRGHECVVSAAVFALRVGLTIKACVIVNCAVLIKCRYHQQFSRIQ